MNMWNFAHAHAHNTASTANLFDQPWFVIIFASLIMGGALLSSLWILKRYTSWDFPNLTERKK